MNEHVQIRREYFYLRESWGHRPLPEPPAERGWWVSSVDFEQNQYVAGVRVHSPAFSFSVFLFSFSLEVARGRGGGSRADDWTGCGW
jgi:hypothetical protein